MFDNPTDNHTDIEVPLYYELRFTKLKRPRNVLHFLSFLNTEACRILLENIQIVFFFQTILNNEKVQVFEIFLQGGQGPSYLIQSI